MKHKNLNQKKSIHQLKLEARRQKLIAKIKVAKDEETIESYEKGLSYSFRRDYDFAIESLLKLMEQKLKRMSVHFHTHNYVEGEHKMGDQIDRALALIAIILGKDEANGRYVNLQNLRRTIGVPETNFWASDCIFQNDSGRWEFQPTMTEDGIFVTKQYIREQKAWSLLWKYIEFYGYDWSD